VTTIYLARHATPDWSRHDLPYHLPPGPPLTETGISEASALGEFLCQAGVQKVFSSPLERCEKTAQIVTRMGGMPLQVIPELQEWQPGEDSQAVHARLWPVFNRAVQISQEAGPVAIITHGGPIGVLLCHLGLGEEGLRRARRFDRNNPLPPAGAWKITPDPLNGSWSLELVFIPNCR